MANINLILSYVAVFVLGLYSASEFRFEEPIGIYRWLIALMLFVVFMAYSKIRRD